MFYYVYDQVKITKGHQVQILKKSIFEFLCIEKAFVQHWRSKLGEGYSRSSSANFLKSIFKVYF